MADKEPWWKSAQDVCAYCAHWLSERDIRCPGCRRKIIYYRYRYATPSANLHIYWVFLAGLGQMYFLQLLALLVIHETSLVFIFAFYGGLSALMFILAAGIYWRYSWAYPASAAALLAALLLSILSLSDWNLAALPIFTNWLDIVRNEETAKFMAAYLFHGLLWAQAATALLALLTAIFLLSPDFDKAPIRFTAQLDRGVSDPVSLYMTGKEYAANSMWAIALLHYQRAVAYDPHRLAYQLALAKAYAALTDYERSFNVLEAARPLAVMTGQQDQLEQLIQSIKSKREKDVQ